MPNSPRTEFKKGKHNPGGNPFVGRRQKFTTYWLDLLKKKDVEDVAKIVLQQAKAGDMEAIKVFLKYSILEPAKELELQAKISSMTDEEVISRIDKLLGLDNPQPALDNKDVIDGLLIEVKHSEKKPEEIDNSGEGI